MSLLSGNTTALSVIGEETKTTHTAATCIVGNSSSSEDEENICQNRQQPVCERGSVVDDGKNDTLSQRVMAARRRRYSLSTDDHREPVSGSGDVTPSSSGSGSDIPLRRRRFHSSDVVTRHGSGSYSVRGVDSPTLALRNWIASNQVPPPGYANLSPAELIRHRQRRRTQSEIHTKGGGGVGRGWYGGRGEQYASPLRGLPSTRSFDDQTRNQVALSWEEDPVERDEASPQNDGEESESEVESESEPTRSREASRRSMSEDSVSSTSSFYSNTVISRSCGSVEYRYEPPSTEKLLNLQKLYQEGFITVTEYKNRRLQLVDELTVSDQTIHRTSDLIQRDMPVVHREPPDFLLVRERDAIKHVFDSENRRWTSSRIKVKIDPQPFAKGGLRQVFHMQDLSVESRYERDGRPTSYVAKIAIDPNENPDTYFRDVEMQAVASKFAKLYNSYNPPRRVEFLTAWIMQLIPTSDGNEPDNLTMSGTICGVEPYIAGEYLKHNNNYGYVSELERNTPQTFSHFTYEASGRQMLIVDIQGVGDHYTDPQIHTRRGKEFGKGNLSVRGFERFLESHRCNPICRYLKLPLNNPKDDAAGNGDGSAGPIDPKGTVPAQTYMSQPRISVKKVDSELIHYYSDSKAFQKYQAKRSNQQQDANSSEASDMANTRAFMEAMKHQRNCASYCGIGACIVS